LLASLIGRLVMLNLVVEEEEEEEEEEEADLMYTHQS
jgi:hypothetical protein